MSLKTIGLIGIYLYVRYMINLEKSTINDLEIESNLLIEALTHPNYSNISPNQENFERLEFLGDAVLDMLTAEWLYQNVEEEVGILSKLRSLLVQTESLAETGKEINLHKKLIVRPKYQITKTDIEDCLEAIFGAVFLSKGIEETRKFYNLLFFGDLDKFRKDLLDKRRRKKLLKLAVCERNPINLLQEYCQKRGYDLPEYRLISKKGKEHEPIYVIECLVKINAIEYKGEGKGRNKKQARMEAAEVVNKQLKIKK
jgi:ribonuclease-3